MIEKKLTSYKQLSIISRYLVDSLFAFYELFSSSDQEKDKEFYAHCYQVLYRVCNVLEERTGLDFCSFFDND